MKVLLSVHDPALGRGGLCLTLHAVRGLQALGVEPWLFHLDTRRTRWRPGAIAQGVWDGRALERLGQRYDGPDIPCLSAPGWPLRGAGDYLPLGGRFGRLCRGFDRYLGVGGAATIAYPLWRAGVPYSLWIATTLRDEWRGRPQPAPARWLRALSYAAERRILTSAERVFALSEPTRRALAALVDPVPRLSVVGYGVDPAVFAPIARPARAAQTMVLACGLRDPRKDVGFLFEVLADLRRQLGRGRLILVSEKTPTAAMRARLEALALTEHVEFRPLRGLADKLQAYADGDLAVLSSRQEGLGIALLEAMATGLPAVSTRCGGPDDYVYPGRSGLLIDLDDRAAFVTAAAELLGDDQRRTRWGQAAAEDARELYGRSQEALRRGLTAALAP